MKRKYLVLLSLFGSVMMFAQIGDGLPPLKTKSQTNCSDNIIRVDTIVWDGGYQKLSGIIERERGYFDNYSFSTNVMPLDDYECYHIAVLRFNEDAKNKSGDPFIVDISADLTHSIKPVYLVFAFHPTVDISVQRIDNYTFQIETNGPNSLAGKAGGGVITAVGIMGRGKSLSGDRCLYVNFEDVDHQSCYESICTDEVETNPDPRPHETTCVEQFPDDIPALSIYPNPAQDYLFAETEGLDILTIDIRNMQGQPVNHQVEVHHTEYGLKIDIGRLDTGWYILQVDTSSGRVTERFFVRQ